MTSFADYNPEVAKQWHPTLNDFGPDEISFGSRKKVWWQCNNGHEWQTEAASRRDKKATCEMCIKTTVQGFVNNNQALIQELISPITNKTKVKTTQLLWQCEKKHEWTATIAQRVDGRKCDYCLGRKAWPGESDIATVRPELVRFWNDSEITPDSVLPNSSIKVDFKCPKSNSHPGWREPVRNLVRRGGCPECAASERAVGGREPLSVTHPDLAKLMVSKKSDVLTYGSEQKVVWKCLVNPEHEFTSSVYNRVRRPLSYCKKCTYDVFVSAPEKSMSELIEKLVGASNVKAGDYSLIGKELDCYVASKKVAFEFNGLYWHSEAHKNKSYHADKTRLCSDKGVQLVHIWEDDWRDRKDIVIRMIAVKLHAVDNLASLNLVSEASTEKIGARSTKVVTLTHSQASVFLQANHIQGSSTGSIRMGLEDTEGVLRAVMIVKTCADKKYIIERYATNGIVQGGFTKLLKQVERTIGKGTIVTYSDTGLSDGSLYSQNGFSESKKIAPDYSYIIDDTRVHKFNYRISRFAKDPELYFEENKTETELAKLNGLVRIWDAGKIRWIKNIS